MLPIVKTISNPPSQMKIMPDSDEETAKVFDPGRTKRAKAFRERLGSSDLSRWEIYTSESTKNKVREIAKAEGLTAGVAAEALLRLGIDAYRAAGSPAKTPAVTKDRASFGHLSSYSSRPSGSEPGSSGQKPADSDRAVSVVRGFLEKAIKRGKSLKVQS